MSTQNVQQAVAQVVSDPQSVQQQNVARAIESGDHLLANQQNDTDFLQIYTYGKFLDPVKSDFKAIQGLAQEQMKWLVSASKILALTPEGKIGDDDVKATGLTYTPQVAKWQDTFGKSIDGARKLARKLQLMHQQQNEMESFGEVMKMGIGLNDAKLNEVMKPFGGKKAFA